MDCSPLGSSAHGILQARILSGLPCPPPGGLPDPGIEPSSLSLQHWQAGSLPVAPTGVMSTYIFTVYRIPPQTFSFASLCPFCTMVTIIATQKVYKFTSPGSYCLSLKLLERVSYIPHLLFLTSYHLIRNPANMPSLLLIRWPVMTLAFDTRPLQLSSQAPPFLRLPLLGPVLHNLLRTLPSASSSALMLRECLSPLRT